MDCELAKSTVMAEVTVMVEVAMLHWLGVIGMQLVAGVSTMDMAFSQLSIFVVRTVKYEQENITEKQQLECHDLIKILDKSPCHSITCYIVLHWLLEYSLSCVLC